MAYIALTIAGSDSGGGAGIQADLKAMSALGVYGASVITAITAQNTRAVTAVHSVPLDIIAAQIDAVLTFDDRRRHVDDLPGVASAAVLFRLDPGHPRAYACAANLSQDTLESICPLRVA